MTKPQKPASDFEVAMSEVLANAQTEINSSSQRVEHVYRTATTSAARDLVVKRDELNGLIAEDAGELDWLDQCNDREVEAQAARYAEAVAMVKARQQDRMRAVGAFDAVIDQLQERG